MKLLVKTALVLAIVFASTFLLMNYFGLITIEEIKVFLNALEETPPFVLGGIIILLLVADLFIAVPTMTVVIFSGFALGFPGGVISSIIGLTLSGSIGYLISRGVGERLLLWLTKNPVEVKEMKITFNKNGSALLLLCRAAPMLPEITSCLAGLSRMPYFRYITWLLAGSIPYTVIAAYAGSVSSFDNPAPAIYTAIGMTVVMWISWYFFNKNRVYERN